MRYLLLLITICLTLKSSAQKLVAIAFYNTENLFDTYDEPGKDDDDFTPNGVCHYTQDIYRQKLHSIATVLKQLGTEKTPEGAALIGLAEIENDRVLAALVQQPEIKSRNYKYIWFDSPDPRGIDVALLYNPSIFRPLYKKAITVPLEVDGFKEATRDILFVRGILAGDTVNILVNHWPSRREGKKATVPKRATAATKDKMIIDSLLQRNVHSRIIVMGDFNDNPSDESISRIFAVRYNKDEIVPGALYDPWLEIYKRGVGSVTFKKKYDLFDQVIISGAFLQKKARLSFYSAEVFDRDFLKTRSGKYAGMPYRSFHGPYWIGGYSDHFPVLLYLQKNK